MPDRSDPTYSWLAELEAKAQAPIPASDGWGGFGHGFGWPAIRATRADVAEHFNVVVASLVAWMSRIIPQADLKVIRYGGEDRSEIPGHKAIARFDRPNPMVTFHEFFQSILLSDVTEGNTFILKVRPKSGDGIHSLWWLPPWDVEVVPNDNKRDNADRPIGHYLVRVAGETTRVDPSDIIHIRDGVDPYNPYRGLAPLKAAARSRSVIDQAESFMQTLMANCGAVPGVVSPSVPGEQIDRDNIPALKAQWAARQTEMNNGTPFFSTQGLRFDKVALSPEEMALDKVWEMPICFVCSPVGVDPMILGYPSTNKTYANYQEATKGAWQTAIIPRQQRWAEAFDRQCPELIDRARERLVWDYSRVEALQTDWWGRVDGLSKAAGGKAVVTVNEARAHLNLPPVEGGDEINPPPPPPPTPPALPPARPMAALPAPDDETDDDDGDGEKSGLSTILDKSAPPEREDDPLPFGGLEVKDDMPPLVDGDGVDPHEDNTFGLPDGKPLSTALKKAFATQARAILGTIPAIGAPIPDAFPPLADYDDPMAAAMTPILSAYWDAGGKTTLGKLGLDSDDWKVTDPNLKEAIRDRAFDFCASTNATTSRRLDDALASLRESLTAGIVDEGETIPQLRDRVKEIFAGLTDRHAEVIARTETARAVHAASLMSAIDSGVCESKRILLSSNACPLCVRIAEETKAGVPLEASFGREGAHPVYSDLKMPPLHVSCLLPETPIVAPGRIAGVEVQYDGPIVRLDFSDGSSVAVTANHMLLTPTGFAPASALDEGDDVICCELGQGPGGCNPDDDHKPARVDDVVHSLAVSGGVTAARVPVAPEYLHGDAAFVVGEIDVVWADSLFSAELDAVPGEHEAGERRLGLTRNRWASLTGEGGLDSLFKAMSLATDGGVRSVRERDALLWSRRRHADIHGIGSTTDGDAGFLESIDDRGPAQSGGLGEGQDAFASQVARGDFVGACGGPQVGLLGARPGRDAGEPQSLVDGPGRHAESLRHILERFAGKVACCKVVRADSDHYVGSVYDVETSSTLYAIGNGIVSSNCRCSYDLVIDQAYRDIIAAETGSPAPESIAPLDPGQKPIRKPKARAKPEPTRLGPSKARVVLDPDAEAEIRAELARVVPGAKTVQDIASLVGAPDGVTVSVGLMPARFGPGPGGLRVSVRSGTLTMDRHILMGPDGPVIKNELFVMERGGGKGEGTEIFARQVENAARLGIRKIETGAARSETMNGYYTWPRLGYDAPLYREELPPLPGSLATARRLSDLMATPDGRAWWKENGVYVDLDFDLADGSKSRRVLDAYRAEKAARGN